MMMLSNSYYQWVFQSWMSMRCITKKAKKINNQQQSYQLKNITQDDNADSVENQDLQILSIQMQNDENRERQSLKEKPQPNWNEFNYPPLLKLMHFRPSQLNQDKKALILMLFSTHLIVLVLSFLNFVDNCIEGGLGILYSILFLLIINPVVLFLFYRAYMGIMRDKGKLTLYLILQPLVIIIYIVISIVDFLGFNGYIRIAHLFKRDHALSGVIGLVVSIGYDCLAVFSCYLFFKVFKQKSLIAKMVV